MIDVRNLYKAFEAPGRGTVVAVNRLSFRVAAGEVFGLLGANGAGKTTTLRMLCTLLPIDEGDVVIDGINAAADPMSLRAKLAYVPAEAGLPERLSPREVVTLFARIQGAERPRDLAESLLDKMGARSYLDTPCGDLSTGMKRRVVLARALVHRPTALLLDEPTDGLDVGGRRDVLNLIREQARDGRAVVLSSHIMGEVERVVDRIGVVRQGTLVATGTVAEVLEQTQTDTLDDAFLALTGE